MPKRLPKESPKGGQSGVKMEQSDIHEGLEIRLVSKGGPKWLRWPQRPVGGQKLNFPVNKASSSFGEKNGGTVKRRAFRLVLFNIGGVKIGGTVTQKAGIPACFLTF